MNIVTSRIRRHSQSRDVIDDVTNRRAIGTFLQVSYWTRTP